jgi:hypothetical protein
VSIWYAIAGVGALTYLTLSAWFIVEAINAPLIDDATLEHAERVARRTNPHVPRGRWVGLGKRHRRSGRAA